MSDKDLRELERRYAESGAEEDYIRLLEALAKRCPYPCPSCGKNLPKSSEVLVLVPSRGGPKICLWCGTMWHPDAPQRALDLKRAEQSLRDSHSVPIFPGPPETPTVDLGQEVDVLRRSMHQILERPAVDPAFGQFGAAPVNFIAGDGIRFRATEQGAVEISLEPED